VSALLATAALALLVAAGFAALVSASVSLAWRLVRGRRERLHPVWRARVAMALALAPSLAPLALVALILAPGLAGALGLAPDHCLSHGEHVHLCFAHPRAALTLPLAAFLALGAGGLVVAVARRAGRIAGWQRWLARMRRGAGQPLAAGVRLIPSERPFSVTVGLWRPEVWVSSALVARLAPAQLETVLAHERAHVGRRDTLRRMVAHALSWPLWPRTRSALLAELALASEQVCDAEAARRVGDRLGVAETIVSVERMLAQAPPVRHPAWAAFGDSDVAQRVHALVAHGDREPLRASAWLAVATLATAWLAMQPLHHATEHVLGWLLRAR
jgi:Zn-dependent protease with chaperone function